MKFKSLEIVSASGPAYESGEQPKRVGSGFEEGEEEETPPSGPVYLKTEQPKRVGHGFHGDRDEVDQAGADEEAEDEEEEEGEEEK
jgi:hypothetical protein